jgi:hypothetical protein
VLKVTEDIWLSMEVGQVRVLLLLDFSQAFDMVMSCSCASCEILRTIWLVLVCWWGHISVNEHSLWDLVVKNLLLGLWRVGFLRDLFLVRSCYQVLPFSHLCGWSADLSHLCCVGLSKVYRWVELGFAACAWMVGCEWSQAESDEESGNSD